jgi:hypothetical protein
MSYRITVAPPEGYIFEGAVRKSLEANITLWTDAEGKVKNFGVLTDSDVSSKTREMGLGWENRTIPTGVLFSYDVDQPLNWTAKSRGLENGLPFISEKTPPLLQGEWPRTNDLNALRNNLVNIHSKL